MSRINLNKLTRLKYDAWQFFDHKIGRDKAFRWFLKSRKKLEAKIVQELSQGPKGKQLPITEIRYENEAQIAALIKKNEPFIIRGLAKKWPCCTNWSLDYFSELYQNWHDFV